MKKIKIKTSNEYDVIVTSGRTELKLLLEKNKIRDIYIITDRNVYDIYKNFIEELEYINHGMTIIEPGEKSKDIEVILGIYEKLTEKCLNRKTTIIAIGGGVVGDIAGFIASTYMRGIRLVHVPTTLLAQCDSSIGGKNGFNHMNVKNIIGTFYQPQFVYIDVNFIKTLNQREYKNGLAEVIKYGFVCDQNLFHFIEENKKGINEREVDKLLHIVAECVRIKGLIVEQDEFDSDMRQILNFGHTVGHAIESVGNFKISHGEAVSIGMNIESYISVKMNKLDKKSYEKLLNLINYFDLPTTIEGYPSEKIIKYMKKDKKNVSKEIKFVLPDKLGHAIITAEIENNYINEILKKFTR